MATAKKHRTDAKKWTKKGEPYILTATKMLPIIGLVWRNPRVRITLVAAPRVIGYASLIEPREKKEEAEHQEAVSLRGVPLHVLGVYELRNDQEQTAKCKQDNSQSYGFPWHFLRQLKSVTEVLVGVSRQPRERRLLSPIVLVSCKRITHMWPFSHLSPH
jgi:hypothetical protein